MNNDLNELADVLEDEVALGETLCRNLEAQKNALIAWNMADLLAHIEAREAWLRALGELEQRRSRIVAQSDAFTAAPRLRQVIAALPTQSPERTRLTRLHEQTRRTFVRLRADEQHLHGLMENLVDLLREALSPLMEPVLSTYGENGAAESKRPASGLLESKV